MAVSIGESAPDFTAKATGNREISLSDYAGKKNVMLVFFPFVFSPVCSVQVPAYSQHSNRFEELDTEVLAISVDSSWSQSAWAEHYGIQIAVLSDFDKNITNAYGVKHDMGMSQRAIFIVDKEGNIVFSQVQENIREIPSLDLIFGELEKIQ